jgi:hypothetical protein
VRREWEPEDLIAAWTLLDSDWDLIKNKAGATRLGFSLLLKFFEQEARFPRHVGELPKAAVDYVAAQVKVDPALLADYDWSGRSIERHRPQIREALGFQEPTRADEDALVEWLATEICPMVSRTRDCGRRCWPAARTRGSSRRAGWSGSRGRAGPGSSGGPVEGRTGGGRRRRSGGASGRGSGCAVATAQPPTAMPTASTETRAGMALTAGRIMAQDGMSGATACPARSGAAAVKQRVSAMCG